MVYNKERKAVEPAIKSALTPLSVIKSPVVSKDIELLITNILYIRFNVQLYLEALRIILRFLRINSETF